MKTKTMSLFQKPTDGSTKVSREISLQNVDLLRNKLNFYEQKLGKVELINNNKMKHLKTTLSCKIEEKDKLIVNLQLFVDEQEAQHKKLLDEIGGEDAEVFFNVSNSLHRFVSQIKSLQFEKI